MGIGKLLADKISEQGLSKNQVAEAAKVPASTLYSIIKRDNTKVEIDAFLRICDVLKCSPEEFSSEVPTDFSEKSSQLTRQEETMIKKYRALDPRGKGIVDTVLEKEYICCTEVSEIDDQPEPMVSIKHSTYKVSAGRGFDLGDRDSWEEIEIPDTPEARKADFAVTIKGNSMEPLYYDGNIVLVRAQPAVDVGETGIYIINGGGFIKQYGGDRLISLNPEYDDIFFSEDDYISCAGKVIGVIQ